MYDLLIHGGVVIDGTGAPGEPMDLAVEGDRIARLGRIDPTEAHHAIDAQGCVIAPGFIDVHNHSDGWLLKLGNLVPKTSQGFTTEVLMSDGMSYAPVTRQTAADWITYLRPLNGLTLADYRGWESLAEYMRLVADKSVQNVAGQAPYANLRVLACGWGRDAPDDTQLNLIRSHLRQCLADGAVSLSTGLDYISQCFASTDELVTACRTLAEAGRPYVTHVRYKLGTLGGVTEAVEIGRRASVAVHISHLKASSPAETDALLSYIDRVAVNEVDFSFDVYPYLPGSTILSSLLPYEAWEQGPLSVPAKLRCSELRSRFAALLASYALPLDRVRLAWVATRANAAHVGLSVAAYAERTGREPAEALADLLIEEQLAALAVFDVGDDDLIEPFLTHPKHMLASDGIYAPDGCVHPRVSGSATRLLGPLVRERGLMTLEEAVRKLTSLPAQRFGLADRGRIAEGMAADLVMFDPSTVADRATYADPHQLSVGIQCVVVNGVVVWRDGKAVEAIESKAPGRWLRWGR